MLHLRDGAPESVTCVGRIAAVDVCDLPTQLRVAAVRTDQQVAFLLRAICEARPDLRTVLHKANAFAVHLYWNITESALEHRVQVGATDRNGRCSLGLLNLL